MSAIIKGEKAGSSKQKKPVIAPDSAQSKTYIKQQIGLGEGEIEGLVNGNQSVLLNETAVEDASGNLNFEGLTVDFRNGTNDQTYMEGFPEVSNETDIQVELKTQWVQSLSDINIDAIRIRLKWGALTKTNDSNGSVNGITIQYAIDLSTDGGTYVEVLNTQISDKTSNGYERSHRIELPTASSGWNIRVRRLTPVSTDPYVTDDMYVASYAEVVDAKFRYPNTALLGLQYDAENFSGVAKVAVELKGLKIRVPSNYDPVTRTYLGVWDGSFKRAYSNNPAWIYYDICTAERYGLGNRITDAMLDKASLYRLAQYCDGQVSDGAGGLEPRFTCNVYIQKTEEAYAILSKIAGVFRAISYWDGDSIICDADIPQDVFYNYTNANVIGGLFEYSGTRARDRPSVVKVAWDNPANNYKTEYEIVRDESAIAKFGIRSHDLEAWGCTSRGQAQRAGIWALRAETQSVSYKVGLDGQIPVPGKVVSVADNDFAGRFIGGRISSISSDRKTLTLDREIQAIPGDLIYVNSEQGQAVTKTITAVLGKTVTVSIAYANNQVASQNAFTIDSTTLKTRKFRVMTVKQDEAHQFSVTALEYNSLKFDAIDSGAYIEESPVSIINPKLQDPVTDVELTTYDQVQQGINIATMIVSWTKAQFATKYLVEWRKDDGTWIKMPITGKTSVEVAGVYVGNYQARITAISAFEISSLPTLSALTAISGKVGEPPKLAFIRATGTMFGMKLEWGFPAVGALDTAYTEIEYSTSANGANPFNLGSYAYPTMTMQQQGLAANVTLYYRGRLVDRIGNKGAWSNWVFGTSTAQVDDILDALNGQISESQLNQDLKTKIDQIEIIDGDISGLKTSVQEAKDSAQKANDDLAIEREERIDSFDTTVSKINAEIQDRKTAIQSLNDGLTQQIINGDNAVLQVVDTVKKSSDDGLAAAQTSIKVVADNLKVTAEKTDGVYAQVNPPLIGSTTDLIGSTGGFAGVWSIQSATIEGDLALSKRIDTTVAQVNDVQAFAQQEVTARVEADNANTTALNNYISSNNSALSSVQQKAETAVTESTANSKSITALDSRVVIAETDASTAKTNAASAVTKADTAVTQASAAASIAQQANATATSAKSTADTAISNSATALSKADVAVTNSSSAVSKVDAVEAKLGNYATTGALTTVDSKVTDVDNKLTAQTTRIDGVYAQVNPSLIGSSTDLIGSTGGFAGVWSIQSATIEGDLALSKRIDTTVAQMNENSAFITSETLARVDADTAMGQRIDTVQAAFESNKATVQTQIKTVSDAQSAQSSRIDTVQSETGAAQSTANDALNKANTANTNLATVQTKVETVTTAQSATANQVGTIQTKIGENTASIQVQQSSINGLQAKATIQVAAGNTVGGIAIGNDGGVVDFIVRANKFAIAPPEGTTGSSKYAFVYQSTSTTLPNGTVVPAGLYLDNAAVGYISANKIYAESLDVLTANFGTFVTYANPANPTGARRIRQGLTDTVYDDNNVIRYKDGYF